MRNPDSLLASRPVTLDEVQRAPELLLPVKRQVDRQRKAGDFLLTGSANLLLMGKVAESLAGRAVYLELPPFCPAEWQERPDGLEPLDLLFEPDFKLSDWPEEAGDWQTWLLRGGFPSALSAPSEEARKLWFTGYVQTYWSATCANSAPCPACRISSASWRWRRTVPRGCSTNPSWPATQPCPSPRSTGI